MAEGFEKMTRKAVYNGRTDRPGMPDDDARLHLVGKSALVVGEDDDLIYLQFDDLSLEPFCYGSHSFWKNDCTITINEDI